MSDTEAIVFGVTGVVIAISILIMFIQSKRKDLREDLKAIRDQHEMNSYYQLDEDFFDDVESEFDFEIFCAVVQGICSNSQTSSTVSRRREIKIAFEDALDVWNEYEKEIEAKAEKEGLDG